MLRQDRKAALAAKKRSLPARTRRLPDRRDMRNRHEAGRPRRPVSKTRSADGSLRIGRAAGSAAVPSPDKRNSLPRASDRQHRRSEAGQARRPRYRPSLRRPKRIAKADKRRTAFRCVRHRPNDMPMQRLRLLRRSIRSVSERRPCPNGKTGPDPKAGT